MRIAVAGTGYVGLSNAVLLAQHNTVRAVDLVRSKVDMINSGKSPIADKEITEYLSSKKLDLAATLDGDSAYKDADFVIISTPTNYDTEKNFFDTSSVEAVIEQVLRVNPSAFMNRNSSKGGSSDPAAINFVGHARCFEDVIHAIKTGTLPKVTGEEARKSVKIICSIYKSAQTGAKVVF